MKTLEEAIDSISEKKFSDTQITNTADRYKPIFEEVMSSPRAAKFIRMFLRDAGVPRIGVQEALAEQGTLVIITPETVILQALAYGVMFGMMMEKRDE